MNRDALPEVPEWPRFMERYLRYRRSLDAQAPDAPHVDVKFEG